LDAVASEQEQIREQVAQVRRVADTLDPDSGSNAERQERFRRLQVWLAPN